MPWKSAFHTSIKLHDFIHHWQWRPVDAAPLPPWLGCDLHLTRINQPLPQLGLKWNDFCSEVMKILALSEVMHHDITPWEHQRSCGPGWKGNIPEGLTESTGKVLALVKASKLLRKMPHSSAYSIICFRHRTWLKVATIEEHFLQGEAREHWGDPCEMSPVNWFSPNTSTLESKSAFWKLIF